jgi:hypothetical protein
MRIWCHTHLYGIQANKDSYLIHITCETTLFLYPRTATTNYWHHYRAFIDELVLQYGFIAMS